MTLIVSLDILFPVPVQYGVNAWYIMCASIEVIVMLFALNLNTYSGKPIAALSVLFLIVHYLGWTFVGSHDNSPYLYFARTIQFTEITTCALLANPTINFIKERFR